MQGNHTGAEHEAEVEETGPERGVAGRSLDTRVMSERLAEFLVPILLFWARNATTLIRRHSIPHPPSPPPSTLLSPLTQLHETSTHKNERVSSRCTAFGYAFQYVHLWALHHMFVLLHHYFLFPFWSLSRHHFAFNPFPLAHLTTFPFLSLHQPPPIPTVHVRKNRQARRLTGTRQPCRSFDIALSNREVTLEADVNLLFVNLFSKALRMKKKTNLNSCTEVLGVSLKESCSFLLAANT